MATRKVDPEVIEQARLDNPCLTLKEIGKPHGIGRERVRQILQRAGLPTGRIYPELDKTCPHCGKQWHTKWAYITYCSPACFSASKHMKIMCAYCFKIKEMRIKTIASHLKKYGHIFCSRPCSMNWHWLNEREHMMKNRR